MVKMGAKTRCQNRLHEYYTPKPLKFQGILAIFTIFVDYADFYVNIIMSTFATGKTLVFIIFNFSARFRPMFTIWTLNVVYESSPATSPAQVNIIYP